MAGRRKVSGFNPLSGNVGTETNDTWVCMAPEKVNYYARADANSKIQKYIEPGEKLRAIKQGDWLSILDPGPNRLESGLYAPVKNPLNQAERLFQNERMMLWDRTRTGSDVSNVSGDGLKRMTSDSSDVGGMMSKDGSQAWICDAPNGVQYRSGPSYDAAPGRLCEVNEQVVAVAEDGWLKVMSAGKETGTFLPMMNPDSQERLFHVLAPNSRMRAGSFRWVDSEGLSHRLSQTPSEDVKQSEVWLCTAPTSIAYCNDPECVSQSSTYVKPGEKINGIKDGPSIKVMLVTTTSTDLTDFIGRRSLKSNSQISIQPTGMYLPFNDSKTGERYFKNEKLILWEQAQNGDLPAKDEGGGCSVM